MNCNALPRLARPDLSRMPRTCVRSSDVHMSIRSKRISPFSSAKSSTPRLSLKTLLLLGPSVGRWLRIKVAEQEFNTARPDRGNDNERA